MAASSSCPIAVSPRTASLRENGSCEDKSDDNVAFPDLAQKELLKWIGRFEAFLPVCIHVALSSTNKAQAYNFSHVWKVPHLVMKLYAGRLALKNVSFLVADGDLAYKDF